MRTATNNDPIAHVVMDMHANQPSGVESIKMTSKYGSRVLLATYTTNNNKLLNNLPKQRSAFVCFANLLVNMPIALCMQMFTSTAAGSMELS